MDEFHEKWMAKFADKSPGTLCRVEILHHGQPVTQAPVVLVDGARAYLPLPRQSDLTAESWQIKLARLVNRLTGTGQVDFDMYLGLAGIVVRTRDDTGIVH